MGLIEVELRGPAPRPTRLRAGARLRFAVLLTSFLLLGGIPLLSVMRQIWAFQTLQHDGLPMQATVLRQNQASLLPGLRRHTLECAYTDASGVYRTATVRVSTSWWLASPPGSKLTITTCAQIPGYGAIGEPSDLQMGAELELRGYGMLLFGMAALLVFGSCLRPYFRDLALVSLGTPVSGRVVGKTWKVVRRLGWKVTLPMIHLHFRDPFGVERVRTQVVDGNTWSRVAEGESMTVLVCARRRGWFAAYPLLQAEAVSLPIAASVPLSSERLT
jgi:hypothetical protein